jgi:C-terminal processing protease CtpA/Prc
MKILIIIPVILLILFSSCRKEEPETVVEVTPLMATDSLYDMMNQWYYWYNLMPAVNKKDYDDPFKLMDAMRYKALDRWSFVADYDDFNSEMNGEFVGHGFRIGLDDDGKARIAMIYENSPLHKNGVQRGWIVKAINSTDIAPILKSGDAVAYNNVIGPSTAGITNIFLFQNPADGKDVTLSSTKSVFNINTVIHYDTLHLSSGITGHLVFESFINPSVQELAAVFSYFKAKNVKDLILDLRYNSGGYLSIAQTLASYIAGNTIAGTPFAKLQYNDKNPKINRTFSFITTSYSLALPRVVVITSRSTASASESVINGLMAKINVVCIGDTTDGKPTGMDGRAIGEKYYFYPVTFKMVNANNQGDYFDGIYPAKTVSDDITHDFADREELCLKEAIHYLETGSLSTKWSSEFNRYPQFSEKPLWVRNGLLIENR